VFVTVFVGSHDKRTDIFKGELQLQAQPGVHSSVTGLSITPLAQVACKKMEICVISGLGRDVDKI